MSNVNNYKLGIELRHENAVSWFKRMEMLLRGIDGAWPAVTEDTGTDTVKNRARLALSVNLGDDVLHLHSADASPKIIWDALKAQFIGVSPARKATLHKLQYSFAKEPSESLNDYISHANELHGKLATADMLDEDAFALLFLSSNSSQCDYGITVI